VFTIKCTSFVGKSIATTEFRDKMPDSEMEGNLYHQYNAAISFINRNLKSIQVEKEFNSLPHLEVPLEVFTETLTNALIHRDYYQNSPVRLFIFDNRIEIISPGILPDSVTEESIKHGISRPRNQLLFENAKYLLPYTGIGSGIVRALKSYDHIKFKNDYVREEFIITVDRPEIPEEDVYVEGNYDGNYDDPKSNYDGAKSNYEGNYDKDKSDYDGNYDKQKNDYDSDYDESKSVHDSDYDKGKNDYDSDYDEVKSVHDGVYDEVKSVHDSVYDEVKSVHDDVHDNKKSIYDGVYDDEKSVYDGVYDEKILAFSSLPRSRKEIMDLLGISTHPKNYERHITPLIEKGLLTMTLPDKPKSKKQKYISTRKGKQFLKRK